MLIKRDSTDLHIDWNANALLEWEIETPRNLIKRAKFVCSTAIL